MNRAVDGFGFDSRVVVGVRLDRLSPTGAEAGSVGVGAAGGATAAAGGGSTTTVSLPVGWSAGASTYPVMGSPPALGSWTTILALSAYLLARSLG